MPLHYDFIDPPEAIPGLLSDEEVPPVEIALPDVEVPLVHQFGRVGGADSDDPNSRALVGGNQVKLGVDQLRQVEGNYFVTTNALGLPLRRLGEDKYGGATAGVGPYVDDGSWAQPPDVRDPLDTRQHHGHGRRTPSASPGGSVAVYQGGAQRWIDAPSPSQVRQKRDHTLNLSGDGNRAVDGDGEEGGRDEEGENEGAGVSGESSGVLIITQNITSDQALPICDPHVPSAPHAPYVLHVFHV